MVQLYFKTSPSSSSLSCTVFLVLGVCTFLMGTTESAACQSCLISTAAPFVMSRLITGGKGKQRGHNHHHHHHHHHHHPSGGATVTATGSGAVFINPIQAFLKTTTTTPNSQTTQFLHKFAMGHSYLQSKKSLRTWLTTTTQDDNKEENEDATIAAENNDNDENTTTNDNKVVTDSMVFAIGLYKNYISPLLPPACRFLPTCSQYGVQAIEKYGPTKGFVLTAWRILRCSPIGGRGYDPPQWPPVNYFYASY